MKKTLIVLMVLLVGLVIFLHSEYDGSVAVPDFPVPKTAECEEQSPAAFTCTDMEIGRMISSGYGIVLFTRGWRENKEDRGIGEFTYEKDDRVVQLILKGDHVLIREINN
jgi:hypothetical protein